MSVQSEKHPNSDMRGELGKYCGQILKASMFIKEQLFGGESQKMMTSEMCGSWRLSHCEDLVKDTRTCYDGTRGRELRRCSLQTCASFFAEAWQGELKAEHLPLLNTNGHPDQSLRLVAMRAKRNMCRCLEHHRWGGPFPSLPESALKF